MILAATVAAPVAAQDAFVSPECQALANVAAHLSAVQAIDAILAKNEELDGAPKSETTERARAALTSGLENVQDTIFKAAASICPAHAEAFRPD